MNHTATPAKQKGVSQVKLGNRWQITVPLQIIKRLNLKKGDVLEAAPRHGALLLKPQKREAREELTLRQRAVIDARLAEALKDIREGRMYGPFDSVKALLQSLQEKGQKGSRKKPAAH